jgi:DNA polymerase elongation subunit (family B)
MQFLTGEDILKNENIIKSSIARRPVNEDFQLPPELPQGALLVHPIKSFTDGHWTTIKLVVNCITIDNKRVRVGINGIQLFIDVVYSESWTEDEFRSYIYTKQSEIQVRAMEPIHDQRLFDYYCHAPVKVMRLYFVNANIRANAIKFLRTQYNRGIRVYSDASTYGSAFDRFVYMYHEIPPFDWWVIENFRDNGQGYYTVNVGDIHDLKHYKCDKLAYPALMNPPFAMLGWDIETVRPQDLQLPLPEQPQSQIKIISYCLNLFEKNMRTEWMAAVHTLKNLPVNMLHEALEKADLPAKNVIIISAKDERQMLQVHGVIMRLAQHDVDNSFNGGQYDHPWVIQRLYKYGLLDRYIKDIEYAKGSADDFLEAYGKVPAIKISAEENFVVKWYPFKSFLTIDTMALMKRAYKYAEVGQGQSLNFYLSINKLPSKVDMHHSKMHELFVLDMEGDQSEEVARGLTKVLEYAIMDAICPNRLITTKSIFTESGQLANLVHVQFEDALLRADGMKITNFIWLICKRHNHLMSERRPGPENRTPPSQKFAGAYVVQPAKGIHKYIPRPGEQHIGDSEPTVYDEHIFTQAMNELQTPENPYDFQSLYPNIQREFNLCPSVKISNAIVAGRLIASGLKLHKHEYSDEKGMLYWTIDHQGDTAKFGMIPLAINILMNMRVNELKPQLGIIEGRLGELTRKLVSTTVPSEEKEAIIVKAMKSPNPKQKELIEKGKTGDDLVGASFSSKEFKARIEKVEKNPTAEQAELLYQIERQEELYDYYDAKQLAVKIMMNTIYGSLGFYLSRLCDFDIARTVTCLGRHALKTVIGFHKDEGSILIYGDTDSTYIQYALKHYQDIFDRRLLMTREEYCRELVRRAFDIKKWYSVKLNAFIKEKFPNGMIKMMPEEILFPVYHRGKKKYIGIKHKDPNFVSFATGKDNYLIKGLEVKTRGKTAVLTDIHYDILHKLMDINNNQSEIAIAHSMIDYMLNEYDWTLDNCAVFKTYKGEDVKNISVNMLYNRIKLNYPEYLPAPYDKFRVAVVQRSFANIFGNKDADVQKMGNRYELYDIIKRDNMKLDTVYYVVNQVGRSIASYLYYLPKFDVDLLENDEEDRDAWSEDKWRKFNDSLKNKAISYIEKYARDKVSERGEGISLTQAKAYYKQLALKYPLLKYIADLKKYFSADNVEEIKMEIKNKTMTDLEVLLLEMDKVEISGESTERADIRLKLTKIWEELEITLPLMKPEFNTLCEVIITMRDQQGMSMELPPVELENVKRYVILIINALDLARKLKKSSQI